MMANEKNEEIGSVELRQSEIRIITNEIMNKKFQGWKKSLFTFGMVFLLVMSVIIAISVLYIADLAKILSEIENASRDMQGMTVSIERNALLSADYLAVVVPILLALGGSFIAFLGMNRLKMFDERIDLTRSEMLKEIESKVKGEVSVDRTEFYEKILKGIKDEQDQFFGKVRDTGCELENQKDKYIKEIEQQYRNFDERYAWLEATVKSKQADLNFYTINDAHILVEQLRDKKPNGYVEIIRKIVDRVCGSEEISGDSSDYHNLSAEIARGSMYIESCKVLKKGLYFFQKDTDLLSDLIEYATKGSMFEDALDAVEQLNNIDYRIWNWRCYEFTCDYYRAIGELEKANELCDRFIEFIPDDEHGYRSKAEVVKLLYPGKKGIEASIEILEKAIEENVNCPQCANALAEMYLSSGRYEDALQASNRAVLELAQQQPHINVSYVFYNRATIQDRMFMQGMDEEFSNHLLVDRAYMDYRTALELGMLDKIVERQAQIRMKILESYVTAELIEDDTRNISRELFELLRTLKSDETNNSLDDNVLI